MKKLCLAFLVAAIVSGPALAQTPAAAPAGAVKAVQPGLFEVAGPRVNDVMGAGITKISAAPGSGTRAIVVESQWGQSYFPWPKGLKQVPFTIQTGKPAGSATINAPGFTQANAEDYKAAITTIAAFAVARTADAKKFNERAGG